MQDIPVDETQVCRVLRFIYEHSLLRSAWWSVQGELA
jgi:hypothetical protein